MKPDELDARFRAFLDALTGMENIDALAQTPQQRDALKADYLCDNRACVIEVKSVQKDVAPVVHRALQPYLAAEDWPVFYGPANIGPFLARHPRKEEILRTLNTVSTDTLADHITKANKQIRTTKATFGLQDPCGLVVCLNDRSEILGPDVIAHRVYRMFRSKKDDGALRYTSIDAVLIVSETHTIGVGPLTAPCLFVGREDAHRSERVKSFSDRIVNAWAKHNGSILTELVIEDLDELSKTINPVSAVGRMQAPPPAQMKRYEAWIRDYHRTRTLSEIPDDVLLKMGAAMMGRFGAHFLKVTKFKMSQPVLIELTKLFTGFIEEMKLRGIGLQEMTKRHGGFTKDLIQRLREQGESSQ